MNMENMPDALFLCYELDSNHARRARKLTRNIPTTFWIPKRNTHWSRWPRPSPASVTHSPMSSLVVKQWANLLLLAEFATAVVPLQFLYIGHFVWMRSCNLAFRILALLDWLQPCDYRSYAKSCHGPSLHHDCGCNLRSWVCLQLVYSGDFQGF